MTATVTERDAFYAAIEAEPENWLNYLVFSDWLRDQGEDDLADGYAAMGRLHVALVSGRDDYPLIIDASNVMGQQGFAEHRRWLDRRRVEVGDKWYVSSDWYDATYELMKQKFGDAHTIGTACEFFDHADGVALGYARLTPEQKAEAERLLATT
jgi:uncharacterized protein (TIGR02996 family)